ncbi:hypothetical protein SAMN05892883_1765 [Jatrophihabitans sp. GAS493]|uniref:carboxypeptidase-like regulatory domain-containing protein n=1 Tax=Jatrophihabitans sp. GAS493 TaxID=1907575 RepID=UPI000BB7FE3C|nr:carboxypeptidase-like regulatory domain-containing protein [Jatrophihabitans sp. GAS493]SOD72364.1 hypothetical protein SAMN05892883_1765 [Jatrophihabitans sp. GAS493]
MTDNVSPTELQLAAGELDETDKSLMVSIANIFDSNDPMPDGLVARVQFAMTLDALHTEVAELQRLSAGSLSYRGEGADEVQTVTFTSASLTTMVTISPVSAGQVRVDGWIAPGAEVDVELRQEHASRNTVSDADGRFVFDSVPRGMAQFILRALSEGRALVVTPSMEL